MGLTLLQQAADEYLRDLGRNKMSDLLLRREKRGKKRIKFLSIFRKVNIGKSHINSWSSAIVT